MTPHGKCVICSRDATHVTVHKKLRTVVARLCERHLGFAPKKTAIEKLEPQPVEAKVQADPYGDLGVS